MPLSTSHTAVFACCFTLLAAPMLAFASGSQNPPEAEIKAENARWAEENRVVGQAAIAAYFTQKSGKSAPRTVSFSNYEFYGDDRMVTEISDTEIRDSSGKLVSRGKQTLIFLKQGGSWKLHRDIWNGNPSLNSGEQ